MKRRKQRTATPRRLGRKPKKSRGDVVADMAASGLVEDEIAGRLGVHKNTLRARHIADIKAGRAARASSEKAATAITPSQFYFLQAVSKSFAAGWLTPDGRSLLYLGVDGRGATSVEDAYQAWNGKYNCSGLKTRLPKNADYARIVAAFPKQTSEQKDQSE